MLKLAETTAETSAQEDELPALKVGGPPKIGRVDRELRIDQQKAARAGLEGNQ